MKLEIENSTSQSSLDYYFFKKNTLEMAQDEVENMLRMGVKLAQEGNRVDARHLLLRVTEAEAENETAWLWLASISEYPEELLIFLQNVLKINPENERAIEWSKATQSLLAKTFVQRGIDASHDGQMDFSKQCFLQAIYYDNENEMAWLWLASITEDVEEKILHLQKVLSFNPENETALSSIKALKKESPQSLLKKANSAAISGDRETAAIMLEEVMQDAPELEEAWILKAYLANDFYEKLGCYEKVLELNPQNEAAQAGMASLKIFIDKVETQPKVEQNVEPSVESVNEEKQETLEKEAGFEPENAEKTKAEFAQEISEPEVFELEFEEQTSVESAEELSENSYSFIEENEADNRVLENESAEDHSFEAQTPELEVGIYEEETSTENVENSAEEILFHSESPTQKLDDIHLENLDLCAQPEVELIESDDEKVKEVSENPEAEFSLNVDDSEVYLIEDAQLSDFNEVNDENQTQNEGLLRGFSEPKETILETDEQLIAEEIPEVTKTYELTDSAEKYAEENVSVEENAPVNNYYGSYDQPTVEFSYSEINSAVSEHSLEPQEETFEPESEVSETYFAESNDSVEEEFESENQFEPAENVAAMETESENFVSESYAAEQENVNCSFCGFSNEAQAISCNSCRSILSLSDLEMLLAHQDADREVLAQTIEMMESEKQMRDFSEEELCLLGIAHLNAKNLRKGLNSLQEASKLNPNDVVLSSKVNFLAIRLSEIEAQENKNSENASVSRMIMVVDDSPTVRKLISGKLEKSGHTVVTANDGIEALSKMNETVPDLILLDIAMPQMDGYQVCKMIRSNDATKDIPVVMISGKDGFFDKVRGKMAGSTGYITKPFGPETLMKTLETYIV